MRNIFNSYLLCVWLGLLFSGSAFAANHGKLNRPAPKKVAVYVFDSTSESFADLLSPGVNLNQDISALFIKKNNTTWTISNFVLLLPYANRGVGGLLALSGNLESGWNISPLVNAGLSGSHFFQPLLLVYYQENLSVNAVPEASAGVMMALGLPLLGWLAWRRNRHG